MSNINDVIKFLKANPEMGRALHEYFEDRREELIAAKWKISDPFFSHKANIGAEVLQAEVLNLFDLKSLSRLPKK
jgi:hypothetical protein